MTLWPLVLLVWLPLTVLGGVFVWAGKRAFDHEWELLERQERLREALQRPVFDWQEDA